MEQSQSFKLGLSQHLAMTPELRQAIGILQQSTQDFYQTVEEAYRANPLLEIDEAASFSAAREGSAVSDEEGIMAAYLGNGGESPAFAVQDEEECRRERREASLHRRGEGQDLKPFLKEQARFTFPEDAVSRKTAYFLIDSLDDRGYLTISPAEAAQTLRQPPLQVERVLESLQGFEPAGVFARSLSECLSLQAERLGMFQGLLRQLIQHHLPEIAAGKLRQIAAAEQVKPSEVQDAVRLLRTLDPKPGSAYGGEQTAVIVPDVIVREKEEGGYVVELNDHFVPRLRLSRLYQHPEALDGKTREYLSKNLHGAMFFLNSIEKRRQTILRVSEEIVRRQENFLRRRTASLRPMTMQEIAGAVGMHESTVSRAVANKYLQAPCGTFLLRSFFTSALPGGEGGADEVKQVLRQLIAAEDPQHPHSDARLAALLAQKGLKISRRTVVKYREQMNLPSSAKRKKY